MVVLRHRLSWLLALGCLPGAVFADSGHDQPPVVTLPAVTITAAEGTTGSFLASSVVREGSFTLGMWIGNGESGIWNLGGYWQALATANGGGSASALPVVDSAWRHLAGVYDASHQRLAIFVNGVRWFTMSAASTTAAMQVLTYSAGGTGAIHDLRVWNYALSNQEVVANRSALSYDWDTGLIGWYAGVWDTVDPNVAMLVENCAWDESTSGWMGDGLLLAGTASGGVLTEGFSADREGWLGVREGAAPISPFSAARVFDPDVNDATKVPSRTYSTYLLLPAGGGQLQAPAGSTWLYGPQTIGDQVLYRFSVKGLTESGADTVTTRLRHLTYVPPENVDADTVVPVVVLVDDPAADWLGGGSVNILVSDVVQPELTLAAIPDQVYGSTVALSAVSSDTTDAITYTVTSDPAGIAVLSGTMLSCTGTGTVTVNVAQTVSEASGFNTDPNVASQTFVVAPALLVATPIVSTVTTSRPGIYTLPTVGYAGLVGADSATVTWNGGPDASAGTGSYVVTGMVTVRAADGTDVTGRYVITSPAVTVVVAPAAATDASGLTLVDGLMGTLYAAADNVTAWSSVNDITTGSVAGSAVMTTPSGTLTGQTQSLYYGIGYTGYVAVSTSGYYTFSTTSDDGSVLKVDGVTVVDNDGRHGATTVSGGIWLESGLHPVDLAYFQWAASQAFSVSVSGVGTASWKTVAGTYSAATTVEASTLTSGLTGTLYTTASSSSWTGVSSITGGTKQFSEVVSAPSLSLSNQTATTYYGLVYTGYVHVDADGYYAFATDSDDGSTIAVDGATVVNNDGRHGTQLVSSGVWLRAGYHPVEIRYYQWASDRSLSVSASGTGAVSWFTTAPSYQAATDTSGLTLTSGLTGRMYLAPSGVVWSGVSAFPGTLSVASMGVVSAPSTDLPTMPRTGWYGIVYSGYITIPVSGAYRFTTTSDDGCVMTIDGVEAVNNDGRHGVQTATGTDLWLQAGDHPVQIKYLQWTGSRTLSIGVSSGPGAIGWKTMVSIGG